MVCAQDADTERAFINIDSIQIEGVSDKLTENIRASLILRDERMRKNLTRAQLEYQLRAVPRQVKKALEPFGYYHPEVTVKTEGAEAALDLQIHVARGEPVRTRTRTVTLQGAGKDDPVLIKRRDRFLPSVGKVFDHTRYERSKARMQSKLLERGYFDASLPVHKAEVYLQEQAADYTVTVDTGVRYAFGDTVFEGSHIKTSLLEQLLPYQRGEPFHQKDLIELHNRIAKYEYFAFAEINPKQDEAEGGEVPIEVVLTPAKRSLYTGGISYGTDYGLEVRAGLQRRYLGANGHKLDADVLFGQQRKAVAVKYRIPSFWVVPGWWSASASMREETISDVKSRIEQVVFARDGRWEGNDITLGWHFHRERFDGQDAVFLSYPNIRISRINTNDLLYPTRGYGLRAETALGFSAFGSDVGFQRLNVHGGWVHGWGEKNRVLARAEVGYVRTTSGSFDNLPPSLRFFAGGDRSVRGYGYQEMGTPNARRQRTFVGGDKLAIASLEYERMLTDTWGAAVFVDAGDAWRDDMDVRVGVGAGARWRSPIGPVRIDLGVGLDDPDRSVQLHFNIGPDFLP